MLVPFLTIRDTLTNPSREFVGMVADYAALKAWFTLTPGFTAYDAAKWAQRAEAAIHGDRRAAHQLDKAGFTLTVKRP